MTPSSILDFYRHAPDYGKARQRDCDIAEKYGLFEKVKLSKTRHRESGVVGIEPLAYDWFYNRAGKEPDLSYVISPDARVPNYSTCLEDALEIAVKRGITSLPVTGYGKKALQAMVDFIIAN